MKKSKSTRGRRPGHSGEKAHKSVHDEVLAQWQKMPEANRKKLGTELIENWRHVELSNRGNYSSEVERSAYILGWLATEYEDVLKRDRSYLELNRKEVKIPLPNLPRDDAEHFEESEMPQSLHETGHDVIWVMNFLGYAEAFRLLGYLIRAAVNKDAKFFKELARRINGSFAMGVPLTSGAEPAQRALASLKWEYEHNARYALAQIVLHSGKKLCPLLEPVFKFPPGKRPPLTLAQIHEFIWAVCHVKMSDRALSRAAKLFDIPIRGRGRPKSGT